MNVTLFNPLFWIAIFIGLSVLIKKGRIKNLLRNTGFILFFVLTNNGVSNFFFRLWEYETLEVQEISESYDIGIVLGPFLWEGGNFPNGKEIIQGEHARFYHAIQLYKLGKFKKFLLSGYDNVDFARLYLVGLGIPSDDILVESKSKNTYENALLSKRLLAQKGISSNKLLMITSAYHMRRAKKCFDKVGLQVTPFSVDYAGTRLTPSAHIWIIPNASALMKWHVLFRECAAMLVFKFKNYL